MKVRENASFNGNVRKTTYSKWQNVIGKNDFYSLKGIVINILEKLGYDEKEYSLSRYPTRKNYYILINQQMFIWVKLIGYIGHIHPLAKKKYEIDETVLAEINLDAVFSEKPSR